MHAVKCQRFRTVSGAIFSLLFVWSVAGQSSAAPTNAVHITHQYANIDSQSLIGLPEGSDKTIVDKQGDLRWSQWSIKHRGFNVPFGISSQTDGALNIRLVSLPGTSAALVPMKVLGQRLYRGRFPFIVTRLNDRNSLSAEELAFSVKAGEVGMDVIRITLRNSSSSSVTAEVRLSGIDRNIPAFVKGRTLSTRDGPLIVSVDAKEGDYSSAVDGLVLVYKTEIAAKSITTIWLKRPYDWENVNDETLAGLGGPSLLEKAIALWKNVWSAGLQIALPEKEIQNFFDSAVSYLFILNEYDSRGNLWSLDGPTIYRHFWPRSEYYAAYAMDMTGHPSIARQTIDYMIKIQKSDGRWDMPLLTSPFAWDSVGYAMATVWMHYEFTHDKAWLEQAYPHLLAAARWIRFSREDTELPPGAFAASRPAKPYLSFSCQGKISTPPLAPGEKPISYGLLPDGFGDSGLPDGIAFVHNVMPLYGVQCARKAALTLGHDRDAEALREEYLDYKKAILAAIHRTVKLEKKTPPYLPATPTCPGCAWSQSLRAVFPSGLFSPNDPLVTGLLIRMRRTARQGLPTNMGFLGPSGVWPGESMEIAQTYLLRGDVKHTVELLIATLNHSTTTKVWKEEILVDKNLPTSCANHPHPPNAVNQTGTGDQPEGWAEANLIMLLRNMLLREQGQSLHLLSGIPTDWIAPGQKITVRNALTMFGIVSYTLDFVAPGKMTLDMAMPSGGVKAVVHLPLPKGTQIVAASMNSKPVSSISGTTVTVPAVRGQARLEVEFKQEHANY